MINPFRQFIPTSTNYAPKNAYALSEASNLAYEDEETVIKTAANWGFTHTKFISKKNTQLFIASNENLIVIAFRGTEPTNIKDWITDAKLRFKKGPFQTRVHRGFRKALKDVWPQLISVLNARHDNAQSLWITGHSLGGALAILCTAYLRDAGFSPTDPIDKPVNGTYVFGSPRVGNKNFELKLNADSGSSIFHFVNNNDIVTRVPPRSLGYSHVGKFLYFSGNGKELEIEPSFWYRFLEFFKGVFEDFGNLGPDSFNDHSVSHYVSRTKSHRNNNPFT